MNYCPRLTHPMNNKILLSPQVRESLITDKVDYSNIPETDATSGSAILGNKNHLA